MYQKFWAFHSKLRNLTPQKMQVHNFIYRFAISPNFKFQALVVLAFLDLKKVFNRTKKNIKKKTNNNKRIKTCENASNLNVGTEIASPAASKFEKFIFLLQLVFELERFHPPIGISVFWLGNPYHVTDCSQHLYKGFSY